MVLKGVTVVPEISSKIFPLSKKDYPLKKKLGEILRRTNCISVILEDDYSVNYNLKEMAAIIGNPSYPSRDLSSNYYDELNYVIDVQQKRKIGISAEILMPLPKHWQGFSLEDAANAVHNEVRSYYASSLFQRKVITILLYSIQIYINQQLLPILFLKD